MGDLYKSGGTSDIDLSFINSATAYINLTALMGADAADALKSSASSGLDNYLNSVPSSYDQVKEGYRQVKTFKQAVQTKSEQEKSRPGWESAAFDV